MYYASFKQLQKLVFVLNVQLVSALFLFTNTKMI